MRKFLVFLFVFIFLPPAINVDSNVSSAYRLDRSLKTDKPMEMSKKETTPKTIKDSIIEILSDWRIAEASFYDANDSAQTRDGCDGNGAFGREIKSGSIALGSAFTKRLKEEKIILFVKIKNCNITTPYGKGIFRVDDVMKNKYNKKNKFYFDFLQSDLDPSYIRRGRFNVKFKLHKILSANTI